MDDNIFGLSIDDIGSNVVPTLDGDYNSEYGDGDIPEIDKPKSSNASHVFPDELPIHSKTDTK